ncbi:EpsG family protein [Konateibacter massiliensis]|uniref:EpsG family protein n=1 Tax=Konateibacter massiliensis TaxID=2002841 RepID=UPI000C156563|nr:EpsG family protein [Konateibacter massiliensis]
MQYLITVVLIIFPLVLKEKKWIRYIQILWLWILIGGCYLNVDTPGYKSVFDNIGTIKLTIEFFYNLICIVFLKLGLSYQSLVMFWAALFIFILDRGIVKLTDKPQAVYSFMYIFPLIDNIVQLKNFAAFAVLIFALHYLLEDDVKSIFKYILCIAFATVQHSAYIIYLLLVIIPFVRKNKRYMVIYVLTLPAITTILPQLINTVGRLVTTDAVVDLYLSSLPKFSTSFILLIWQMSSLILLCFFTRGNCALVWKKQFSCRYNMKRHEEKVVELIILVNLCFLLICSLYFVDAIFQRLSRNLLVLDGIAYSILWKYQQKTLEKYLQILIWIIFLFFSALAFYALSGNAWNSNKIALENNIFWR